METKLCSSDKEEAFKRELPYCTGEINFTASGKKHGKVWALRSCNTFTVLLLFSCYFLAVNKQTNKVESATMWVNVPERDSLMYPSGLLLFTGFFSCLLKFMKVRSTIHPGIIFEVMLNKWKLPAPNLVISLVGGEENFQMKPWLRDALKKGFIKAAESTGAWIFTSALRVGVTRHLVQAVRDLALASTSSTLSVIAIGITSLRKIQHREILDNTKGEEGERNLWHLLFIRNVQVYCPPYSLDHNHSHFILVDHTAPEEPDGTTKLRFTLEKYISEQRTGYGGKQVLGLENSAPWLILAGSGGTADILAAFMNDPQLIMPEAVEKQFKEKFPAESFSTDFVCISYFLPACKSQSQEAKEYLDELKLAVAWNRVDIAKSEIFNGDVEWKSCDLEEVMMDALVNNKPEFVKLFIDNGANIYEFLTYSRLQRLYCSISQKCLLYELLLKKHEESKLTLAGPTGQQQNEQKEICPLFTLSEVSRVLKDFLHDACKGFYQDLRHGGKKKYVSYNFDKTNTKRVPGPLDMNQKSENPWRDLFVWAVLQNRHKMANYFWAMVSTEDTLFIFCLCFLHMAELFSECYHNSEERAFALLVRKNQYWSKTTCLQLATEADAKSFFAHDGVQVSFTCPRALSWTQERTAQELNNPNECTPP
uniref:TRPM SLOG domain-containing protein n=1 Tax=Cyanoderma ruficeps TaxID=181631 RepID=A0A8C3NZX1_9PASS